MTHREYLLSLEHIGIKLGLDQIRALLERLDHPERTYRTIVIAGTNGKGSVAALVERGLRAAGARTGRFTSPHLVTLEERFVVNGVAVTPAALDGVAGRVRQAAAALTSPPSFFEATTAVAFELFRNAHVEVAVLEVGLGGRLDATNVTSPVAVGITSIALDHEAQLGRTLAAIAGEKAGVIGPNAIVVAAPGPPEVERVIATAAAAAGARLVPATVGVSATSTLIDGLTRMTLVTPRHDYGEITLALRGRHQADNAVVAVRLLEELSAAGVLTVPAAAVRAGLETATWPGRLDLRSWHGTPLLIDGAHNPAGARALAAYVTEVYQRPAPIVVGIMQDKVIDDMIAALAPAASHLIFTAPMSPRAATPAALVARAAILAPGLPVEAAARPADAIARAASYASGGTPVVVAGSLYLAGEILAQIP